MLSCLPRIFNARHLGPCLLAGALLLGTLPDPVQAAPVDDDKMTLNFVNADIDGVIKAMSQLTGRNFVVDPRVKGSVNIISGSPVSRELSYQILVSALRMQGFAVVESGGVTRVLPEADAKFQPGPALRGSVKARGEALITQVFPIRYESAAQLLTVIKPLISANNTINAYPNTNTLVITDYADNLRRIEKIIDSIDIAHGEDPQIITLRHVSAIDLAQTLNRIFAEANGVAPSESMQRVSIVPDAKSNALIVRSDNPAKVSRVRKLVGEMDIPQAGMAGNVRVVFLKHAEAAKLAVTLRAILSGENSSALPTGNQATTGGTAPPPAPQFQSNANTQPNFSSTGNLASNAGQVNGSLIQADPATNALIITAPEPIYNNLRQVIDQLDRRRAQVYLEALVVELTADKAAEFGIQWQSLSGLNKSGAAVIGGTNFSTGGNNIIGAATNVASIGKGLNIGIVNGQISLPGINGAIANLGFLARFLESDSRANILSTPNILTLDNEEAKIVIGQNLPFITGSYAQTGNAQTATPFQTYERKDVGLTLKVKPQITEGGIVRVQIYQEASSVQATSMTNASGPITNKRSLESTVLVDDGNIIALGGLIQDNMDTGEEKVPFLGDVPLVGGLFRYEKKARGKTNLMVFLRPKIVRNAEDYRDYSAERYTRAQAAQQEFADTARSWMSNADTPQLPALPPALPRN